MLIVEGFLGICLFTFAKILGTLTQYFVDNDHKSFNIEETQQLIQPTSFYKLFFLWYFFFTKCEKFRKGHLWGTRHDAYARSILGQGPEKLYLKLCFSDMTFDIRGTKAPNRSDYEYCRMPARWGLQQTHPGLRAATRHGARDPLVRSQVD